METALINQPFKLPHPVAGFTFFAEDQVLTADHLNQLIHYFNYQQRETRAWLIGTGIVCGLKISIEKDAIHISKGCGISSDGDLFTLPADLVLTHLAPFTDENAKYSFLLELGELRELTTASAELNGAVPLTEKLLQDTIIALYLESYVKEPDFCTTENCDNQGKIQHHKLHVLLFPRSKSKAITPSIQELATLLPEVYSTRAKIQEGVIHKLEDSTEKSGLQSRFTKAIAATHKSLISALEVLKNQPALAPVIQPTGFAWADNLVQAPNPSAEVHGLQNIYAFYQDITQAYREWRDSLLHLTHSCTPEIGSHPKHLLLGDTIATPDHPPHPFRHRFIPAGTFSALTPHFKRSQLLWQRLSDLTKAFSAIPPIVKSIKILPTKNPGVTLGERAVPAYYGLSYSGLWNVDLYLRGDLRPPLSFATAPDKIFDTIGWEVDFFRVEGHLGQRLDHVEAQLKNLRREHNLCFEVLAIQIEDDPAFAIPRPHRFFDLETAYHNHRTHLKLQLRDVRAFVDKIDIAISEGTNRIPDKASITKLSGTAGEAKTSADVALEDYSKLPVRMSQLSNSAVQKFSESYFTTINKSSATNHGLSTISDSVMTTPIDRITQPEASAKWKLWHDLLQKRRLQVAQLSTFEKFVEANHGLEHLGGVPRGGTFILVYSASENEVQRIVKADFCLPYFSYFDLHSLEEIEPVEPETPTPQIKLVPPPWNYDWKVANLTPVSVHTIVKDQATILEGKLTTTLRGNIQQSFEGINLLSGIMKIPQATKEMPIVNDPGSKNVALDSAGRQIKTNRAEIERLKQQQIINHAKPDVQDEINELEIRNADLAKKGLIIVSEETVKAQVEGRILGVTETQFFDTAFIEASKIENKSAQNVIKDATQTLGTQHIDNSFIAGNMNRFTGMFGH